MFARALSYNIPALDVMGREVTVGRHGEWMTRKRLLPITWSGADRRYHRVRMLGGLRGFCQSLSPLPASTCGRASTCSGTPQPLPCSRLVQCSVRTLSEVLGHSSTSSTADTYGTSGTLRRRMRSASSATCSPGALPPVLPPGYRRGPVTVL
jgi:hypothetical protein